LAALVKTVSGVSVTNGVLTVQSVYGSADDPELTALEVVPAAPAGPPTVSSTSPASGATGVSVTAPIKATFSRAMDPTTITSASFSLAPSGGSAIGAVVSYDSTTNTATLTPSAALAVGTTYTATITTAVKASDGAALASPFTWSFTTVAAPTVTSTSPANG